MNARILLASLLCGVALRALGAEDRPGFAFARSETSLSAGLIRDAGGETGFFYSIKSSSFARDSPVFWGFSSMTGCYGGKAIFESGVHAGAGGPLAGALLGLEAYGGPVFGGLVRLAESRYEARAPAALLGLALSFPYRRDFDLSLRLEAFLRPYDLAASRWDWGGTYLCLALSMNAKRRAETRVTSWSEGL